jgi:hypothetical protein
MMVLLVSVIRKNYCCGTTLAGPAGSIRAGNARDPVKGDGLDIETSEEMSRKDHAGITILFDLSGSLSRAMPGTCSNKKHPQELTASAIFSAI